MPLYVIVVPTCDAGDSVSAGYISYVQAGLQNVANVQHGPDNAGGGYIKAGSNSLYFSFFDVQQRGPF